MRGKGISLNDWAGFERITPAYAGKRCKAPLRSLYTRDHPRVCGEKKPVEFDLRHVKGSPPRMQGKVLLRILRVSGMGITPAYAGKSSSLRRAETTAWDHPRVCGEKMAGYWGQKESYGSPPRMRGKGY